MIDSSRRVAILYVETPSPLRETIIEYLEDNGHRVIAAEAAEEALACLQTQPFDVLYADMTLPGQSGLTLAKTALEFDPKLRIIITTAYDIKNQIQEMMSQMTILLKPFELDNLINALHPESDSPPYTPKQNFVSLGNRSTKEPVKSSTCPYSCEPKQTVR